MSSGSIIRGRITHRNRDPINLSRNTRENYHRYASSNSVNSSHQNDANERKVKPIPVSFQLRGIDNIMKNNPRMFFFQFDDMDPKVYPNHFLQDLLTLTNYCDPSNFIGMVFERYPGGVTYKVIMNNVHHQNELRDKLPKLPFMLYGKSVVASFARRGEFLCYDIESNNACNSIKLTHAKSNLLEIMDKVRDITKDNFNVIKAIMTNYTETYLDTEESNVMDLILNGNSGPNKPFIRVEPNATYLTEKMPKIKYEEKTEYVETDDEYKEFIKSYGFLSLYDNNTADVFETRTHAEVKNLQSQINNVVNILSEVKEMVAEQGKHKKKNHEDKRATRSGDPAQPTTSRQQGRVQESAPRAKALCNDVVMVE